MNLYPVNLNIADRLCLIVGGGAVAGRKAEALLSCGAKVVVVSPQICRDLAAHVSEGRVEWCARSYSNGDLEGAFLVFAATNNREVQHRVIEEANEREILVNAADAPKLCTFQVPARVRRGGFLLTVSTSGGSPALAGQIRKNLEDEYGEEYEQLVELLSSIREKIVRDGNTTASHKKLFKKLLQLNLLVHLRGENWSALLKELYTILPEEMDVDALVKSIKKNT